MLHIYAHRTLALLYFTGLLLFIYICFDDKISFVCAYHQRSSSIVTKNQYYSSKIKPHLSNSILSIRNRHYLHQRDIKRALQATKKNESEKNNKAVLKSKENNDANKDGKEEPSAFDKVASMGLAGVLAIALAEAIFWALGVPFAELWVKYTTGEWIDFSSKEGQLQAAGFSFGYGGFATVILQYRVTLFAIPLVPLMDKYVVTPGKKYFGDKFDQQ